MAPSPVHGSTRPGLPHHRGKGDADDESDPGLPDPEGDCIDGYGRQQKKTQKVATQSRTNVGVTKRSGAWMAPTP
jgi:hypothetical protein